MAGTSRLPTIPLSELNSYVADLDPSVTDLINSGADDATVSNALINVYASAEGLARTKLLLATDANYQALESSASANRGDMCTLYSGENSSVSQAARDCMCGATDPYLHCGAVFEQEFNVHKERMRKQRRDLQVATTCNTKFPLDSFFPGEPQCEKVTCSSPVPETDGALVVKYEADVCVPSLENVATGVVQVCDDQDVCTDLTAETPLDLKRQAAEDLSSTFSIKLCLNTGQAIATFLDFVGIDVCFVSLTMELQTVLGLLTLTYHQQLYTVLYVNIDVLIQLDDTFKNALGLCSDGASCDTDYCQLTEGQAKVKVDMGGT